MHSRPCIASLALLLASCSVEVSGPLASDGAWTESDGALPPGADANALNPDASAPADSDASAVESDAALPADASLPDSSLPDASAPPPDAGLEADAGAEALTFPRLAGMNIGGASYDDATYQQKLARLDLVILGMWKDWKPSYGIRQVVQNLKALNPRILVGQYTILNEVTGNTSDTATADLRAKLDQEGWWARDAAGERVQWTADYGAYETNFTAFAAADSAGRRWSQWRAERDYAAFFQAVPELDLWYFDNVFYQPRATADWNLDGSDDSSSDPAIAAAYRAGHLAEWERARSLRPDLALMGNTDNDLSYAEFQGQLEGAFDEALLGQSWSIESWGSWSQMMQRYRSSLSNTRAPHLAMFNVHGVETDYQLLRYGLASCLLDDGLFAYTDTGSYNVAFWFDEFDLAGTATTKWLGQALEPPPTAAWQNGVYRRLFEHGMALVNPKGNGTRTVTVEAGYRHIQGTQAPSINDGQAATTVILQERDGLLLVKP